MKVAIIPARGGSKRIPRKNIKHFRGKPLIAYSIDAAIKSNVFDRIIVSTDDQEIADVAKSLGAEVPFLRSPELSDDFATTDDVLCHALEWLTSQGKLPTFTCCLYATAPFVSAADLKAAYEKLASNEEADYCFSVTSFAYPIQRALRQNNSGQLEMMQPEHRLTRSQDLEEAWHDAGQFYFSRADAWLRKIPVFSNRSIAWELPRYRVQDIDTLEDWQQAEVMHQVLEMQGLL